MYKTTFLFILNATAMVLTGVSGFYLMNEGGWNLFNKPAKLIIKRDTDVVNASESFVDLDPCLTFYHCFMTIGRGRAFTDVFEFDFRSVSNSLSNVCKKESPVCSFGECDDPSNVPHARFIDRIIDWACAHQSNFTDGLACWSPSFKSQMRECPETHRIHSPQSPAVADLLDCFALVPELLDECSEGDATFVEIFTRGIIDFALEMLPDE